MTRVVKPYDDRRIEFLDATKTFFFTVGYERMSIQMLTQQIGVAKGTFYHYFKSKEDLLSQWVLHEMSQIIIDQEIIASDPELSAIDKFNAIIHSGRDWKLEHMDMIVELLKVMHHDHNIKLYVEMTRQSASLSKDILTKVILQGINEGVFSSEYPEEVAAKIPSIAQLFSKDFGDIILKSQDQEGITIDGALKIVSVWQDIIERILGAPKGSIIFVDREFVKAIFEHLSTQAKMKRTA